MNVKCMGCGQKEFVVDAPSVEIVKVISFICPECGEYTSVQERPGGGIVVAIDKHSKA